MSIKIPLSQLAVAQQAQALAHIDALVPPGAYKFRVAKLLNAVEHELTEYTKQQRALVLKLGVAQKDAKGKPTGGFSMAGASPENLEAFGKAMEELLNTETLIPYEPIVWSRLGEEAQAKLSVGDIRALGPLLTDDSDAAPPAPPLASVK